MIAYEIKGDRCPVIYAPNKYTNSGYIASALQMMGARPITGWIPSKDYIIAQNIRHHCDVIVEAWFQEEVRVPFPEYVRTVLDGEHMHLNPRSFYAHVPTNYYLRYNNLQLDLDTMLIEAGLPRIQLPPQAEARPRLLQWWHFFPYNLKISIWERYHTEMQHLGFNLNRP